MLEDGLAYPTRGEWTGRQIIGSMLVLFGSVLLFPLAFVYGYYVRALRTSVSGEPRPPVWERWLKLLVDGLKSFLVTFVYALIPNLVAGVVLFLMIVVLAGGEGSSEAAGVVAGLGVLGSLVVFLVNLVVFYLLPAALTTFAAEDSARAAFSLGTVTGFAFQMEYLLALVHATFAIVFASILASTVLLAPFAVFWLGVSLARLFGTAYRETMVSTTRQEPSTGDAPSPTGGTQDAPTPSGGTQDAPTPTGGTQDAPTPSGAERDRSPTPNGSESTGASQQQSDAPRPDGRSRTRDRRQDDGR